MADEIKSFETVPHIKSKKWSRSYDSCQECGTTKIKHSGKGFCEKCYNFKIELTHKSHQRMRGVAGKEITKEFLEKEYIQNQKSLTDIARICSCTRQFIHKKMKEYGIQSRDMSSARRLAISSEKCSFEKNSCDGHKQIIKLKRHIVNESFFSTWSIKMAYVLGVFFTDGNLSQDHSILRVTQKETELLEKLKVLMECDAPLEFRARKEYEYTVSGEIYSLSICSKPLYDDLVKIGLTPDKSLTMKFPFMPIGLRRHFIRGCWDGDGSVYIDRRSSDVWASFVCGSLKFIEMLVYELSKAGLKDRKNLRERWTKSDYSIRYTGVECEKLYCFLYHKVAPKLYLSRKHDIFMTVSVSLVKRKTENLNPDFLIDGRMYPVRFA